jgi:large repetitive protein
MRKPDTALKFILLTASVVLLVSSSWAVKAWQQFTANAIIGTAFFDCNSNGIRDNNEAPFDGMNVMLTGTTSAGNTVASIMATDNMGNYSFTGVEAGTYAVKFLAPAGATGLTFTTKNAAANGSDVNANGSTDSLSIDGIMDMQGVDAGIIDRTAPIVTFTNPFLTPYANGDTITVQCDNLPTMNASWASATDNTGKPVKVEFIDLAISTNECARTGYITLLDCIFRATDACGNVGQKAVFVKVKDSKAPVISGVPSDITVNTLNGERVPANSGVSALDNCAANPVPITFTETEAANTCGKTITRTWSASDDCGNIARRFQIITVISNSNAACNSGGGGNGGGSSDTIRLVLTQGVTIDTCLNLSAGSMLKDVRHCSAGQPSATITLTASNCLRITPSVNFVGLDTFCARVCDVNGQNCRDMKLMFRVQAARLGTCDILSDRNNINLMPRACGEDACYCIVGTTDIQTLNTNYTVTDNGRIYNGGLSGCQFDTIFSYNYFTVPNMGATGSFRLDYWRVNGTNRQIAAFQTIQQLTDSMNIWDPMGNWRIDNSRFLIYGGDNRSQYGQMKITALSNSAFGLLDLNTGLISNGVKLCFSRGLHNVVFQNNLTGCADTLRVNVFCADDRRAPIAVDDRFSTMKNRTVRIAATLNDTLNGLFESVNLIGQPLHGSIIKSVETFLYTPNTDYCGRDTVDYRVCNSFGLCDTGRIFIETTCSNDTTGGGNNRPRPVAVDDVANTRVNTATTFSVLANDMLNGTLTRPLSIIRFQMHGSVSITNNQITYTPANGFCNAKDTFDYEICNENGCDTGRVVVNVSCEGDTTGGGTRRPVAVDDNASTRLNMSVTIPVLANDIINGTLARSVSLVRFQEHGTVNVVNNQFIYTPMAGFCNARDSFDYEICNANGCDTGRVIVTVMCESDTVSSGSRLPVAFDDAVMTRLNTPITISVLANDSLNGVLNGSINITRFQSHGTVNVINNRILYTPDLGFCGNRDTFNYAICNANGCDTAQVIVTVTCENDGSGRPVAVDDRATTRLDSRVTIPILDNDIINGTLISAINIVRQPRRGTSFISNNQLTYMPNAMSCGGNDTLDYVICNAIGCDTASVIIAVTCNDTTGSNAQRKPLANDDRALTRVNMSLTISPLANDTLNGVLTRPLSILASTRHGQAFVMSNQIVYMPNTGYCGGNDTLTYEICNSNGCDTAQIIIEVSCDNGRPKPIAVDDVAMTRLNTPVTISVLTNDVLNGNLSVPLSIVRSQTHGVASVVNNQIIYTPSAGYCNGLDTLDYAICNGNGCDTGRLIITISCDTTTNGGGGGSNRVIVAVNDNVTTTKNTGVTFRPTLNDTIRTKLLSLSITGLPRNGDIGFRGLDTLLYTPNRDFCGKDSLTYIICDTSFICSEAKIFFTVTCNTDTIINGGNNRKPNAFNDVATTQKGRAITIAVLRNDSTYGTLTRPVTVIRTPRNGTTAILNNQIVYTPNPMFCGGQDTLTYEICNANGCDTGNVFVAVTCDTTVNNGGSNRPVVAVNDNVTTRKNTSLTFKPTDNDTIRTKLLSLMIINPPRNGSIGFRGLDTLLYTPNLGFCGRDTFEYSICDTSFNCNNAFVFINVTCDTVITAMRKPKAFNDFSTTKKGQSVTIAALANDSTYGALTRPITVIRAPRNGTTAILNNQVVYTPNPMFCGGQDTLSYEICNANGCDTALIYVAVTCDTTVNNGGSNRPIVAVNDNVTTRKNTQLTFNPTVNDTIRTRLLALMIINAPRNGSVGFRGLDTITYTPNRDFCGRDTFEYSICDTSFNCASAFVYVNVTCDSVTNNILSPIGVPDYATTRKNTPIRINILTNDTLNGVLDSIRIISLPRRGTAAIGSDNVLTYSTDTCGFTDTLVYRICNRNGCDTALVAIKVSCDTIVTPRVLPIAINDTASTKSGQPVTISVLQNDTLNGILAGRVGIILRPRFGIAIVNGNNEVVYTPQSGFCGGRDTLSYEICNASGCDTALVSINVVCDSLMATLPPVAVFDEATARKNMAIRIPILANDTLNGTLDSIKIIRSPLLGIASLGSDNVLTYTPDSCGFTDSLVYRICNRNGCDTAIVRIKVSCDTAMTNLLAPVAVFDTIRTPKGQLVTIRVTLNDTLRGADTFRITRSPLHGIAMFDADRHIAYKSDSLYCGNDTLIYEICNNRGCDTALVIIKVTCDTVPTVIRPDAVDDFVKTIINRRVDFVILGNDILRGARFAEMVSPPSHGTIIIMPDSMAMYKPDKEFCGKDSFRYRICNTAGCDTAMVRIDVSCGDTLQVFGGFSPNNDGKNDKLVIRGIENHPDNEVIIMNRWGNQVFNKKGYRNESGWDGSWSGKELPDGTYFYCIRLNDPKNQQFTGYIQLMR